MINIKDCIAFMEKHKLNTKNNISLDFSFANGLSKKELLCLVALLTLQETNDINHSIDNANEWNNNTRDEILLTWFIKPDIENNI